MSYNFKYTSMNNNCVPSRRSNFFRAIKPKATKGTLSFRSGLQTSSDEIQPTMTDVFTKMVDKLSCSLTDDSSYPITNQSPPTYNHIPMTAKSTFGPNLPNAVSNLSSVKPTLLTHDQRIREIEAVTWNSNNLQPTGLTTNPIFDAALPDCAYAAPSGGGGGYPWRPTSYWSREHGATGKQVGHDNKTTTAVDGASGQNCCSTASREPPAFSAKHPTQITSGRSLTCVPPVVDKFTDMGVFCVADLDDRHINPINKPTPRSQPNPMPIRRVKNNRICDNRGYPIGEGCTFCRNNGETCETFMSHNLKNMFGEVVCPILAKLICPICEATGKQAHTLRYCPQTYGQAVLLNQNIISSGPPPNKWQ